MIKQNNMFVTEQYLDLLDQNLIVSKTDPEGIITFANDKFVEISGYSQEELIGKPQSIVRHPDMSKEFFVNLWKTIKIKKKKWTVEIKNRNKQGSAYYVDAIIKPVFDKDGSILEFIALRYDVTQFIDQKKKLIDELAKTKRPILVMVQIEEYENLESFYGKEITHLIEDKFAMHLLEYCPIGCNFAKVFPLENGVFALIKDLSEEDTGIETLTIQLKKLQQNIKDGVLKFGTYEYDLNVILSYAIDSDNILEDVTVGLKRAKESKKDFLYADSFTLQEKEVAKHNLQTINMIKKAIEHHDIVSYFQPIVDAKTGEIVKYESLVRLIKQDGSVLSPFHFLDIAKNGRYYHQITEAVIENSFIKLRETNKGVTINLSTLDIEDAELRNRIINLLTVNVDIAHQITFELLEDEDVHDFNVIKDFISLVKMLGVTIAIDDFGSGHSNFERLLSFQPDILKIDGSLIKDIATNHFSRDIVETIKLFADKQKIKTVAEFVSTKETLEVVREIGIDYLQGYLLAEPDKELVQAINDPKLFK
ncbi:MAG TPA: EAL domain-containing protein [Arcobacter sp.]|nr:EAL domain-containing protein [Arcobacter sp.]